MMMMIRIRSRKFSINWVTWGRGIPEMKKVQKKKRSSPKLKRSGLERKWSSIAF